MSVNALCVCRHLSSSMCAGKWKKVDEKRRKKRKKDWEWLESVSTGAKKHCYVFVDNTEKRFVCCTIKCWGRNMWIWHLDTGKLTDGHIEELSNEVDWVTRISDKQKKTRRKD